MLGSGKAERQINIRIPAGMSLKAGDQVRLVISSRQLLNAAVLAYGVPLAGLLMAAGVGWLVTGDDRLSALTGAAGLIAGVWMSRRQVAAGAMTRATGLLARVVRRRHLHRNGAPAEHGRDRSAIPRYGFRRARRRNVVPVDHAAPRRVKEVSEVPCR